jgi:hypothetical protein
MASAYRVLHANGALEESRMLKAPCLTQSNANVNLELVKQMLRGGLS